MGYNIIKFGAVWCGQCQVLDMNLRKAGIPYRSVDVDDDQNMTDMCNVRNVPTIVVTDGNGNEVERFTGAMTVQQIKNKLGEYVDE